MKCPADPSRVTIIFDHNAFVTHEVAAGYKSRRKGPSMLHTTHTYIHTHKWKANKSCYVLSSVRFGVKQHTKV